MSREEPSRPDQPELPEDDYLPRDVSADDDEEPRAADDYPDAHLKIEKDEEGRSRFYKRGSDGRWEEQQSRPVSGDPEVNAIGDLDYEEVEAIVEDPEHPKHALAKEYLRLSSERMRESLRPITDQYSSLWRNIIGSTSALDLMKGAKLPETANIEAPPGLLESIANRTVRPQMPDYSAIQPIHNPMWDVLAEQRTMNKGIVDTNEHLAEMVAQSKKEAAQADARAAEERRRGQGALGAAWAAVGVTVLVGIVQIIQNM